jgi:tRNA-2-methylthio-N6-dimethylallyladenosine synthase
LDLFRAIKDRDKVCEALHLPVQSGSDKILAAMNRGYTGGYYLNLVRQLRELVPDIALYTDIIVGFPGESEQDFQLTCRLMEEIQYDGAFIFKYSLRPGTGAARLEDDVPLEVKKERNKILLDLQNEISDRKNKALVGKRLEVLVEGVSKNNRNRLMGRTRTNKIVVLAADKILAGRLVPVTITAAGPHTLFGELCS